MDYKVVPFTAAITRNDSAQTVATQMQSIINTHTSDSWEYLRMDSIDTNVAPTAGCFGLGAQPGFSTTFRVLVFKKP